MLSLACGESSRLDNPTAPSAVSSGSAATAARPTGGPPAGVQGGPPASGGQNAGPGGPLQTCSVTDRSTEQVIPGVMLTWTSSFFCGNAPNQGSYRIDVQVANESGSAEAVRVEQLRLSHTTPRPQNTRATAQASGLPVIIPPGGNASFAVNGNYTLVSTDEGNKLNIHLQALGKGASSSRSFQLGINVQLRAPGATE